MSLGYSLALALLTNDVIFAIILYMTESTDPSDSAAGASLHDYFMAEISRPSDNPLDEQIRSLTPMGGFPIPGKDTEMPELADTFMNQERGDLYLYQLARQLYMIEGQFVQGMIDAVDYRKLYDHIMQRRSNYLKDKSNA